LLNADGALGAAAGFAAAVAAGVVAEGAEVAEPAGVEAVAAGVALGALSFALFSKFENPLDFFTVPLVPTDASLDVEESAAVVDAALLPSDALLSAPLDITLTIVIV
jgi:hypothetical protein